MANLPGVAGVADPGPGCSAQNPGSATPATCQNESASDAAAKSPAQIDDQHNQENQPKPSTTHRRTAEIKSAAAKQKENQDN